MTDEEKKEIYYPDGRINPDKAINFVREEMKTMSPEEFRRHATTPVQIIGEDRSKVRTPTP